jgi:hypothetical protein
MGGCLILESLVLLNWCERNGFGPLGITGLSMGGHMASLAATNWPKPLVLVPCLSWSTAASVFTQGVMSQSINWDRLENEFLTDGNLCDRLAKMVQVVDEDSFLAGKQFIKKFNQSMKELKSDIHDVRQQFDSTTKVVPMNANNDLLHTLLSKDATDFTNYELNMINSRIKDILNNIEEERRIDKELRLAQQTREKSELTLEAATNAITNATNGISSYIYAGSTKLMSLILPQKDVVLNDDGVGDTTAATTKLVETIKTEKIDITKTNWWEREALQFMRGVMDECTHLKNFSVPFDTSLIIAVCAKDDAYVPRDGCTSLEEIWPGVEIKYIDAGHVTAYVLHQKLFRSCIIEAFERAKKKHGPLPNPVITTEFLNLTKTNQITDNAHP